MHGNINRELWMAHRDQEAKKSLNNWPSESKALKRVNDGENTTYRVDTEDDTYLLRVHREKYRELGGISDEIKWLQYLRHHASLQVPKPIATMSGDWVVEYDDAILMCPVHYTLLTWVHGGHPQRLGEEELAALARVMAELHQHSIKLDARPTWDVKALLPERDRVAECHSSDRINGGNAGLLNRFRDTLRLQLKHMCRHRTWDLLLHSDLHQGNIIVDHSGKLCAIDFDDCGYGQPEYELAVPLANLVIHHRESEKFEKLKWVLVQSYQSYAQEKLNINLLMVFIGARLFFLERWYRGRLHIPGFQEKRMILIDSLHFYHQTFDGLL